VDCGDGLEFFCIGVDPSNACCSTPCTHPDAPQRRAHRLRLFSALWRSSEVAYNVFESFRGGESGWSTAGCSLRLRNVQGRHVHHRSVQLVITTRKTGVGRVVVLLQARIPPVEPAVAKLAAAKPGRSPRAKATHRPGTLRTSSAPTSSCTRPPPRRARRRPDRRHRPRRDGLPCQCFGADREHATEVLAMRLQRGSASTTGGAAGRERLFWERWAPLVALLPGFDDWSTAEKRRPRGRHPRQSGRRESEYVARFDAHPASARARVARPRKTVTVTIRSPTENVTVTLSGNGDCHLMTSAACLQARRE